MSNPWEGGSPEARALRDQMRRSGDYSYLPDLGDKGRMVDDILYGRDQTTLDRWDEDLRKGRIDAGSNMINAHFDGGTYGTGQVNWSELPFAFDANPSNFAPILDTPFSAEQMADLTNALRGAFSSNRGADPTTAADIYSRQAEGIPGGQEFLEWALGGENQFYDAQGNPVTDLNQILELGPKGQLFTGGGSVDTKFDDAFFAQQGQAYRDWANPQVQQQFGDANRNLSFALSGMGHSAGSSTMVDRHNRLKEAKQQSLQDIGRQSVNVENQARQGVENERMDLLSMNQSVADPSQMANMIPGRLETAANPQQNWQPLGNAFQNVTAGLGQYMQGQQMANMGFQPPRPGGGYNLPPIYGGGSGSGRNYG